MTEQTTNKLSIICFSGDFDKALAAVVLANGGLAFDYEVNLFFTFWGLNILKKKSGRKAGHGTFMQRMFNVMMGGRDKLPLSKFNFAGMGPKLMTGLMKKKGVKDIDSLLETAIALGANIYACEMAMSVMGVTKEELIDEAQIVGVGKFMAISEGGQVLFI
jgi:peroxiredoxin family protein